MQRVVVYLARYSQTGINSSMSLEEELSRYDGSTGNQLILLAGGNSIFLDKQFDMTNATRHF